MKRSVLHRRLAFATIVLAMMFVWGILLPQLSATQRVRDRQQWLDEHQIDPAAMFYTDLPMMDRP
ncbi:hypothetical protein FYK55_03755 [Roseiconus nitratireducens]|uniref:Uncharacterized protein n=1 Tax=Roseiconus nitratireducens TaxID=2605748 RepID=A0A5M6DEQ1_9BACT|nr:hypothetical protein [Roseiconus nitratireducens]KAA5546031.1 hypothetical protein FYK55_03755 [Roseiconus nitratireducens]